MTIDLEAIRARCEAATRGPWGVYHDRDSGWVVNEPRYEVCTVGHHKEAEADAQFITSSRSDVPALFGLVDHLTRALLRLEDYGNRCAACSGFVGHSHDCFLDAALTAVGLDTQEKRNQARKAGG